MCTDGKESYYPYYQAQVILCKTENFGELLLKHCKSYVGKSMKPRLDSHDIKRLLSLLTADNIVPSELYMLNDYHVKKMVLVHESTSYYDILNADYYGENLWAKRFKINHLSAVDKGQELANLGREAQALKLLGARRVPNVQYCYGTEKDNDDFYIFLQPAPETNLTQWLKSSPTKLDKLTMLVKLAYTIESISNVDQIKII